MIIYKTTNLINGKIYVGQDSKNNSNYLGSGKYIINSIKKYGKENFKKEYICECSNKEKLDEKEIYWIKELNSKVPNGYNIVDGGTGGDTITNNPNLDFIKKKMSELKIGKHHSEETKEKIRESIFGKHHSEETKEKIGNKSKGRKHTKETKKKLYDLNIGKKMSEEIKFKMRKPKSEEHKINMSKSAKLGWIKRRLKKLKI